MIDQIRRYTTVAAIALALALGGWSTWKTLPDSGPKPEPAPKPLIEPTDDRPLVVAEKVTIPDRGMIRLPLKTIGTVRVVEYPGVSKSLQVEQFGNDVLLSRRSQVAEDCYLGLQCEHKGAVGPVAWVMCDMGHAPLPPPTPEPDVEPKPKPEPKPVDPPSPIPAKGLRVLILYDEVSGKPSLSLKQSTEIYGAEFTKWLDDNCAKDAKGQPEWRRWPKNVSLSSASELWRQVVGTYGDGELPRIIISNGVTGFAGKLPETGILDLVKKYRSVTP
jgi:hypothetical protein